MRAAPGATRGVGGLVVYGVDLFARRRAFPPPQRGDAVYRGRRSPGPRGLGVFVQADYGDDPGERRYEAFGVREAVSP